MTRPLWLSVTDTQSASAYTRHRGTWDQFVKYLTLDRPSATKDCGNIVGGVFTNDRRSTENLELRSVASFDVDHPGDMFLIDLAGLGLAATIYTTWRSTVESPRYRVWIPLSRDVLGAEYWALTRAFMIDFDPETEPFDPGSSEAERLMHLPSTRGDGSYWYRVLEGQPLDVDEWLLRAAELGVIPRGHREAAERPAIDTSAPPTAEEVARAEMLLSQAVAQFGEEDGGRHYRVMAAWPNLYRFALGGCFGEDGFDRVNDALQSCFDEAGIPQHAEGYIRDCSGYADHADRPIVLVTDPAAVFEALPDDEPALGAVGDDGERFDPYAPWVTSDQPFIAASHIVRGIQDLPPLAGQKVRKLIWWRGGWWQWKSTHWEMYSEEELIRHLYRRFTAATVQRAGQMFPYSPGPANIGAVLHAMKAHLLLEQHVDQPSWMGTDNPGSWMSCKSGIMRIDRDPEYDSSGLPRNLPGKGDRLLLPHDPHFFTGYSVPFDYDAEAKIPRRWLDFLEEVLPDADERVLLQQWFGYCLSGRLEQEKALLIVGPTRSGKGTIATILSEVMGRSNVTSTKVSSLGKDFGLQPLLGKPLAIVGDARMERVGPGATESLLGIIGRDSQSVPRKYGTNWEGVLPTRFLVMSNDIPHFDDPSGAVMGRFALLRMRRSWLGREDFTLKDRLLVELPGIFNWALDGIDMLEDGARLAVPHSSIEAAEDMGRMAAPVTQWVAEQCDLHDSFWAPTTELFSSYSSWFTRHNGGTGDKRGVVHFARQLRAALPGITALRRADGHGYSGIRLLSEEEQELSVLQAAAEELI